MRGVIPVAVIVLASVVPVAPVRAEDEPLPYTLGLRVEWGHPVGPDGLRGRIEHELLLDIQRRDCFRATVPARRDTADTPELLFEVRIDDYEEEEIHDLSLAQRFEEDAPAEQTRQFTIRVRADFNARVTTVDGGAVVRKKHFIQSNMWRPVINEDPRYEAQSIMVHESSRVLRGFVCSGSPKKWAKQIAKTRPAEAR